MSKAARRLMGAETTDGSSLHLPSIYRSSLTRCEEIEMCYSPLAPGDTALDRMTLLYVFSGLPQPFTWNFQGLWGKAELNSRSQSPAFDFDQSSGRNMGLTGLQGKQPKRRVVPTGWWSAFCRSDRELTVSTFALSVWRHGETRPN